MNSPSSPQPQDDQPQREPNTPFPQPGDTAPDVALYDGSGRLERLSAFWLRKPTVLLFVRHFG